ncbi:MAG: DUF2325 domain-containing protein [Cyanobacteria bacterium P01_D01_bin.105]
MLKSLIQPLQLFIKGATGKDRHLNQQLTQQLMRLEVAYDGLQKDYTALGQRYDSLKVKHSQLTAQYEQLKARYDQITGDQKDWNALLNYADKESKELSAEKGKLRSQLKRLESEKADLVGQVAVLEHKLGLREYDADYSVELEPPGDSESDLSLMDNEPVDLSDISLALVGGHETTHREVKEELKKYGLKRCIHVPPHSRESNSRHQIKDKISNCDLVVTITSYVDHSVVECVKKLKASQMLTGEVIRVHTHGKSSVVREVLDYFATQSLAA